MASSENPWQVKIKVFQPDQGQSGKLRPGYASIGNEVVTLDQTIPLEQPLSFDDLGLGIGFVIRKSGRQMQIVWSGDEATIRSLWVQAHHPNLERSVPFTSPSRPKSTVPYRSYFEYHSNEEGYMTITPRPNSRQLGSFRISIYFPSAPVPTV